MKDLLSRALELANKSHKGQTRWDKKTPYVTHPIAVVRMIAEFGFPGEVQVVAALHDVVEDTSITLIDLKRLGYPEEIVDAVDAMSRRNGEDGKEDYLAYILRVKENSIARVVKIFDITHNLSDVKPKGKGGGSMRDKYRVARHFLASGDEHLEMVMEGLA